MRVIRIKGQVSTELLIIVAAILVLFIPLLVVTYFKANEANEQIMQAGAQIVAIRLAELSNAVGSSGGNSSIITEIYIPSNVKKISIASSDNGAEIIVRTESGGAETDIIGLIKFPVEGMEMKFNSPGLARFEISKIQDKIVIVKKI